MNTYIALFRGINVGGNNILPMKVLVEILAAMGYRNVKTYIQSGNVVFQTEMQDSKKIAKQIGLQVLEQFQFEPKVLILELADLQEAIKNNPFETKEGKALHFSFLESKPEAPDLEGLAEIKSPTEEFKLIGRVFYLFAPDGIGRSKLVAKVERSLGVSATGRNWNTVSKLLGMVE